MLLIISSILPLLIVLADPLKWEHWIIAACVFLPLWLLLRITRGLLGLGEATANDKNDFVPY